MEKNLEAKIYTPKVGGLFYVYIYDVSTKKIVQKYYKGVNNYPTHEECRDAALDLLQVVRSELKAGWVPRVTHQLTISVPIKDAFNQAIERLKSKVSKNTFIAYSCTTRFFVSALDKLKFSNIPSDKFTRAYAKKCLDTIVKDRNWSNHAYNKNLGYIRSVFSEIIESEQAEINPFREMRNLKVEKKIANRPPTDKEMRMICAELKKKNYGFYRFYMLIYNCGLRPVEAVKLKIKNLDFENKVIRIYSSASKNRKEDVVPMMGNVYDLLIEYKDLDGELFLFGTWKERGGRISEKNWFSPNKYNLKNDTPTKQWKKLIKDGLKLDVTLYSGKHKGADDKREAGISIETISKIFRHSTTKMTERYMHGLKLEEFENARKIKMKEF